MGAQHILEHFHQHFAGALVEGDAILGSLRHGMAGGVDPPGKLRVMDQLLHLAVLKFAETHLPQILQLQLAHAGEQQVGALSGPQHRADKHQWHRRVGKALFQPGQLGASLVAQRQVGAAADITPLQIPGGETMADEMQFVVFQDEVLLFPAWPE